MIVKVVLALAWMVASSNFAEETKQAAQTTQAKRATQTKHVVTDAEAAHEAKEAFAVAKQLWEEGDAVCRSDDLREIYRVSDAASRLSKELDMNHLAYRARFPYFACQQALIDITSRMNGCDRYSTRWDVYIRKRWNEDIKACAAAIRKPDRSLKDIK